MFHTKDKSEVVLTIKQKTSPWIRNRYYLHYIVIRGETNQSALAHQIPLSSYESYLWPLFHKWADFGWFTFDCFETFAFLICRVSLYQQYSPAISFRLNRICILFRMFFDCRCVSERALFLPTCKARLVMRFQQFLFLPSLFYSLTFETDVFSRVFIWRKVLDKYSQQQRARKQRLRV